MSNQLIYSMINTLAKRCKKVSKNSKTRRKSEACNRLIVSIKYGIAFAPLFINQVNEWGGQQTKKNMGDNKAMGRTLLMAMKLKLTMALLLALPGCMAAAQGVLEKGLNADRQGLVDLAEGYYRQAVDTNATARLRLGLLLERTEHFAEAAHWLAAADTTALGMTHLAVCHSEQRHWADAKRAAEKAVELCAEGDSALRASAMATLGLVNCIERNYTNALSWANRALEQDPKSARALNVKGIIHYNRGQDREATQAFRQALQADPKNVDAHFNLGAMYCYRNSYDLAITTLKKGLKVERSSIKLIYCLGWAYLLKGEKESAIECLEEVIQRDSTYANAYNRLGDIYFDRAEYNRAIAYYRTATRIDPKDSEAYRLLGRTYAEMGENGKALRNYQRATELNKSDAETYCRLAELYEKQKQPKRVRAYYVKAAKLGHPTAQKWCTERAISY